jgi:hypothetical protein
VKKKSRDTIIKNEWYNFKRLASLGWGVITVDLNGVVTFINRGIRTIGLNEEKNVSAPY